MRKIKKHSKRTTHLEYPTWPIVPLAVVLAFLMLLYNERVYASDFKELFFYSAWLVSSGIATFLIYMVYRLTLFLDLRYPWYRNYNRRLTYQLVGGVLLPILISFLLISVYFLLNSINVFNTIWFSKYLLQIVLLLVITNLCFQYYWHKKWYGAAYKERRSSYTKVAKAIDYKEIACIFSYNKYCYSIAVDGQYSVQEATMKNMEELLPSQVFYRVNRSFILNLNSVTYLEVVDAKHTYVHLLSSVEAVVTKLMQAVPKRERKYESFTFIESNGERHLKVKVTNRLSKVFENVYWEFKDGYCHGHPFGTNG